MADIIVRLENYDNGDTKPGVVVGTWEGQVHMNATAIDDGYPSMDPHEARALAAVLLAQADEAERA